MNKYISLHTHSEYSVLDGLSSVDQLVNKTVEFGFPALAITDHGNMNSFGWMDKLCKKAGIKPIFGCEFYIIDSLIGWQRYKDKKGDKKESRKELSKRNHLIVLAKNKKGFENINKLVYESSLNFYYRPRIDKKLLEKYSEGLIVSTACLAGEIQQYILTKEKHKAVESLNWFKERFGNDFYCEVQFNEIKDQARINSELIELANKLKIKTIVTTDAHYPTKWSQKTHQTLLLMNSKSTYKDLKEKREGKEISGSGSVWEFEAKELYYKNYRELLDSCKKYNPDISVKKFESFCDNTLEIADKIELFELNKEIKIKDIRPDIKDKKKWMTDICFKALKEKGLNEKKYNDRLKFELEVIFEKNFQNYFVVVADIVRIAKEDFKSLVGAGRGSGAGSLVNYLLGITSIDPIKYDLLFERFLDVTRTDLPDIDIDFEDNDKMKRYIMTKYPGESACISNYNTFKYAGLLQDLGRVYNLESPKFFDDLNKKIRKELEIDLMESEDEEEYEISYDELFNRSQSFKDFMIKYKELKEDFELLLNKIKGVSKHAAGVVICDNLLKLQPVMEVKGVRQTPLSEGAKGGLLGEYGFVKIDILGIKTLKIIHETVNLIAEKRGDTVKQILEKINPEKINLESEKVFNYVFKKYNTQGVFQFETDSMKNFVKKVKPDNFDDLCAMNALYRPGPLKSGIAFEYGDRKRGLKPIDKYNVGNIDKILEPTFGILVYQEQVMKIASMDGNLSIAEVNILRKVISKNKNKLKEDQLKKLEEIEKNFQKGCIKNGYTKEKANELWKMIENYGSYCFNKSHSLSYAMIAYQCAYLKAFYPVIFYSVLLNHESFDNYFKITNEIKRNKIEIIPVSCQSNNTIREENDKLIWGFGAIKGIGEKASDELGKYYKDNESCDLYSFLTAKIDWRTVNKRVIQILIKIGFFDEYFDNRKMLLNIFEKYSEVKNKKTKIKNKIEWDALAKSEKKVKDFSDFEKMKIEYEYYGCYLKLSPFNVFERDKKIEKLEKKGKLTSIGNYKEGKYIIACFDRVSRVKDRRGREMAFVSLSDNEGNNFEGIIFSSAYEEDKIIDGAVYTIRGKMQDKFLIEGYENIDSLFSKEKEIKIF